MINIAISTTTTEMQPAAEKLASELGLPYTSDVAKYDYVLMLRPEHLALQKPGLPPFYIDFLSGKISYRARLTSFRKELLAKAIGLKPKDNPFIVDATAGLGRDSFILASLGFQVTMLERSAIFYALLKDALERATQDKKIKPIIERLNLINTDAIIWLKNLPTSKKPDVIYLDPMFPERKKSASVKKEMVIMQELLGKCSDDVELFHQAISCASKRIVVKRPKLAPNIGDHAPNFSMKGKANRFDVYLK